MLGANGAATDHAVKLDDGLARHGLGIGDDHFALLFKRFSATTVGGLTASSPRSDPKM